MNSVPYTSVFPKTRGYIETDCKVCEAYDELLDASLPHPEFLACKALWDTGAMRSTISVNVAKQLGLIANKASEGVSCRRCEHKKCLFRQYSSSEQDGSKECAGYGWRNSRYRYAYRNGCHFAL